MSVGAIPTFLPIKENDMDKMLRAQIAGEVRRVLMEVLEGSQEQWVSADELGKHISFCTRDWLKNYGSTLPRTRAMVTTPDGVTHQSAYTYPLHKIQRMLANNEVKFLKL